MSNLKVLLADDHEILRDGLKLLVNSQSDMEVIGEAENGRRALELAAELCPDVVVTDVSMPGLSGAEVTLGLKRVCSSTKVIALTVHEDRAYLRQLLEAGANGYVLKRSAADELVRALRVVASGGSYLDPALAGTVAEEFRDQSIDHAAKLSNREAEVAKLIAMGFTNKEIAGQLEIGTKSVETYKARSLEKLGLESRAELVRYALERGWLESS